MGTRARAPMYVRTYVRTYVCMYVCMWRAEVHTGRLPRLGSSYFCSAALRLQMDTSISSFRVNDEDPDASLTLLRQALCKPSRLPMGLFWVLLNVPVAEKQRDLHASSVLRIHPGASHTPLHPKCLESISSFQKATSPMAEVACVTYFT